METYKFLTLYKINRNGNVIGWDISFSYVDNLCNIITKINHNIPNGKETIFRKSLNVKDFKSAHKIVTTLWKKKQREGYKIIENDIGETINIKEHLLKFLNTSLTDKDGRRMPMKAKPFVSGKFIYPAIMQPKINGVRGICLQEDKPGIFTYTDINVYSNRNLKYKVNWLSDYLKDLIFTYNSEYLKSINLEDISLDGELYKHGVLLQEIRHRLASNVLFKPLDYYIFDIAYEGIDQYNRLKIIRSLFLQDDKETFIEDYYEDDLEVEDLSVKVGRVTGGNCIHLVNNFIVYSEEEARNLADRFIKLGFEGGILRSMEGEYSYGRRSNDLMKFKRYYTTYVTIVDVIPAPKDTYKGKPIAVYICQNDKNSKTFKVNPEGSKENRAVILESPKKSIGNNILIKFYERTKDGIPFHANEITR